MSESSDIDREDLSEDFLKLSNGGVLSAEAVASLQHALQAVVSPSRDGKGATGRPKLSRLQPICHDSESIGRLLFPERHQGGLIGKSSLIERIDALLATAYPSKLGTSSKLSKRKDSFQALKKSCCSVSGSRCGPYCEGACLLCTRTGAETNLAAKLQCPANEPASSQLAAVGTDNETECETQDVSSENDLASRSLPVRHTGPLFRHVNSDIMQQLANVGGQLSDPINVCSSIEEEVPDTLELICKKKQEPAVALPKNLSTDPTTVTASGFEQTVVAAERADSWRSPLSPDEQPTLSSSYSGIKTVKDPSRKKQHSNRLPTAETERFLSLPGKEHLSSSCAQKHNLTGWLLGCLACPATKDESPTDRCSSEDRFLNIVTPVTPSSHNSRYKVWETKAPLRLLTGFDSRNKVAPMSSKSITWGQQGPKLASDTFSDHLGVQPGSQSISGYLSEAGIAREQSGNCSIQSAVVDGVGGNKHSPANVSNSMHVTDHWITAHMPAHPPTAHSAHTKGFRHQRGHGLVFSENVHHW